MFSFTLFYYYFLDQDWRADSVRWRNNGYYVYPNTSIKAEYFVLMDGPKQDKRYPQNQGLKKKVYSHSDYPDLFYIRYLGDRGLSKGFCHQN